jgi:hypothetical protein
MGYCKVGPLQFIILVNHAEWHFSNLLNIDARYKKNITIFEVIFRTTSSTCGIATVDDGKEGDWSNSIKVII